MKLVLLRHGWSEWNEENRFTGWTDVDLHSSGVKEAEEAGEILKKEGYEFDIVLTSVQQRAIKTTYLCLHNFGKPNIPVQFYWQLNERHYGALQGLNKAETAQKHGLDKVMEWRRGYAIRPPALNEEERVAQQKEKQYSHIELNDIPGVESLADVVARIIPWYEQTVLPLLREGKKVLISAHGNSLRALIKYLDAVSDEEIVKLTLPTAIPWVYELDENFKPTKHYYLGDPEVVARRIAQAEYAMYNIDGKRGP